MASGTVVVRPGQEELPASSVHWLPVKTTHNGPCRVNDFFTPSTTPAAPDCSSGADDDSSRATTTTTTTTTSGASKTAPTLEAALRGRRLKGCERRLPDGYAGVVLAPAAASADASADERSFVATAAFSGLTYWVHDSTPAASDWQARSLDWLAVAERAHAPVDEAAVEEERARLGTLAGRAE